MEIVNKLLQRGVRIATPASIEIGAEVDIRAHLGRGGGHPCRVPDFRGADADPPRGQAGSRGSGDC